MSLIKESEGKGTGRGAWAGVRCEKAQAHEAAQMMSELPFSPYLKRQEQALRPFFAVAGDPVAAKAAPLGEDRGVCPEPWQGLDMRWGVCYTTQRF